MTRRPESPSGSNPSSFELETPPVEGGSLPFYFAETAITNDFTCLEMSFVTKIELELNFYLYFDI